MEENNEKMTETEQKRCEHCQNPLDDSLYYCPHCGCKNPYYQAKEETKKEPATITSGDPGFPLMVILATPLLLFSPLAGIPLLITGTILQYNNKKIAKRYRMQTLIFCIILIVATVILLIQMIAEGMKRNY